MKTSEASGDAIVAATPPDAAPSRRHLSRLRATIRRMRFRDDPDWQRTLLARDLPVAYLLVRLTMGFHMVAHGGVRLPILQAFATETAALTRAQILVQSGTTVLAIANQNPQNVLALLR